MIEVLFFIVTGLPSWHTQICSAPNMAAIVLSSSEQLALSFVCQWVFLSHRAMQLQTKLSCFVTDGSYLAKEFRTKLFGKYLSGYARWALHDQCFLHLSLFAIITYMYSISQMPNGDNNTCQQNVWITRTHSRNCFPWHIHWLSLFNNKFVG